IWGDHVLHRRSFRSYPRYYPARYSDPLWMRLVTNAVRRRMDAEVAVSRNLPRTSDMIGPVPRALLRSWLQNNDAVAVVSLRGDELLRLGQFVKLQDTPGAVPPEAYLILA